MEKGFLKDGRKPASLLRNLSLGGSGSPVRSLNTRLIGVREWEWDGFILRTGNASTQWPHTHTHTFTALATHGMSRASEMPSPMAWLTRQTTAAGPLPALLRTTANSKTGASAGWCKGFCASTSRWPKSASIPWPAKTSSTTCWAGCSSWGSSTSQNHWSLALTLRDRKLRAGCVVLWWNNVRSQAVAEGDTHTAIDHRRATACASHRS